jgi:HlyD family secretion protein
LGDTENMFVDAEVYVSDVRRVREGAKAVISGDALPRETSGRVIEILRETSDSKLYPDNPLNAADKRVIKVRIGLENPASLRRLSNSQVFVKIEP